MRDIVGSCRTFPAHSEVHRKEVPTMPTIAKEFTIRQEDEP